MPVLQRWLMFLGVVVLPVACDSPSPSAPDVEGLTVLRDGSSSLCSTWWADHELAPMSNTKVLNVSTSSLCEEVQGSGIHSLTYQFQLAPTHRPTYEGGQYRLRVITWEATGVKDSLGAPVFPPLAAWSLLSDAAPSTGVDLVDTSYIYASPGMADVPSTSPAAGEVHWRQYIFDVELADAEGNWDQMMQWSFYAITGGCPGLGTRSGC